jgi:hypothetical protein
LCTKSEQNRNNSILIPLQIPLPTTDLEAHRYLV